MDSSKEYGGHGRSKAARGFSVVHPTTAGRSGEPRTEGPSGLPPVRYTAAGPVLPQPSLKRDAVLALKRVADIVLSVLGLIALGPLVFAVAIAIRTTSPGPAVFTQPRTGIGGKTFKLLKFRTMYVDRSDPSGIVQAHAGDGRVTPLGRFLRRTSVDELPQLINVIMGDMSLVGPRPHAINMLAAGVRYDELVPYYALRHTMRPGISGWAQANGLRGPTDDPDLARARIEHDLAYIQNFSLSLDFRIIVMTLYSEFITGSGI